MVAPVVISPVVSTSPDKLGRVEQLRVQDGRHRHRVGQANALQAQLLPVRAEQMRQHFAEQAAGAGRFVGQLIQQVERPDDLVGHVERDRASWSSASGRLRGRWPDRSRC